MRKEAQGHKKDYPDLEEYFQGRLDDLLCVLSKCMYDINKHGVFTQEMVNKYGLLSGVPDSSTTEGAWLTDPGTLRLLIGRTLRRNENELYDMLVVLDGLCLMAHQDRKPLIIW